MHGVWTDGWMGTEKNGLMVGWMDKWMDKWMDGCMNRQMDEWRDEEWIVKEIQRMYKQLGDN